MFSAGSKLVAEATGRADNCSVYMGREAVNAHSEFTDFLLPDDEPQMLLKCFKGEYIFTDRGIVWVYGEAAVGKKRVCNRLDFNESPLSSVTFETAGLHDWDCQLRFTAGSSYFAIDIKTPEQEIGIRVYRVLTGLLTVQQDENRRFQLATTAFQAGLGASLASDRNALDTMADVAMRGADAIAHRYKRISYKDVYEKYMTRA